MNDNKTTAQSIINQVYDGLSKQGRKSIRRNELGYMGCAYRGNDGCKCAVGQVITDDEYQKKMEGDTVFGVLRTGLLPARLHENEELLAILQNMHDNLWDETQDKLDFLIGRIADAFRLENPAGRRAA